MKGEMQLRRAHKSLQNFRCCEYNTKNTAGSGSKTAMTRRRYTTALSDRVCQSHGKRNSAQKEVFDVQFLTSVSHLFSV